MFDLRQFTIDNLVGGYEKGAFLREQVSIFAVNYMVKGIITQGDLDYINEKVELIDNPTDEPIFGEGQE